LKRQALPAGQEREIWGGGNYFPIELGEFAKDGFIGRIEVRKERWASFVVIALGLIVLSLGLWLLDATGWPEDSSYRRLIRLPAGLGGALVFAGLFGLVWARDRSIEVNPVGIRLKTRGKERFIAWNGVRDVVREKRRRSWVKQRIRDGYEVCGVRVSDGLLPLARSSDKAQMDAFVALVQRLRNKQRSPAEPIDVAKPSSLPEWRRKKPPTPNTHKVAAGKGSLRSRAAPPRRPLRPS
jgi:hypothetical protein